MGFLNGLFKKQNKDAKKSSVPQIITFAYTLSNPNFEVLHRSRNGEIFSSIVPADPFFGFKAEKIIDVPRIYTGPGNLEITSRNITKYIEEPCIPVFLKLQSLGIQTYWSSANSDEAVITIISDTLSEKNKNIAKANGLYGNYRYGSCFYISFPINKNDSVQSVSNEFLKLASVFEPQLVLYGQESQSEFLNGYSKYDGSYIAKISNIDINYIKDHFEYLLKTFPQYVSYDGKKYICNDMPDELFQREILDRNLLGRLFYSNPNICINGTIWSSKELYEINEYNRKKLKEINEYNMKVSEEVVQDAPNNKLSDEVNKLFELMLQEAEISENREEVLAIAKRVSFMDSYKICYFAENVKLADEPEIMRWLEDGIIRNNDLVHIYEFMFLMVDSGVKSFNLKRFEDIIIESKNPKLMCYCIGFVPGIDFNRMLNALYETKCAKYIERLSDEEFELDVNSLPGYHKKLEVAKKYDYFPESLSVFVTRDITSLISGAIESKTPYLINEVADYIEYLAEYKGIVGLDITPLENAQLMYADPLHLYEFAASVKSSNKIAFQNRVVESDMPKYMYYMYEYVPGVNKEELNKYINKSGNKKYMDKVGISR